MSEATKCDRCGAYIDKPSTEVPRIVYALNMQAERYQLSLCYECYNKFKDFMEELGRFDTNEMPI